MTNKGFRRRRREGEFLHLQSLPSVLSLSWLEEGEALFSMVVEALSLLPPLLLLMARGRLEQTRRKTIFFPPFLPSPSSSGGGGGGQKKVAWMLSGAVGRRGEERGKKSFFLSRLVVVFVDICSFPVAVRTFLNWRGGAKKRSYILVTSSVIKC